MWTPGDDDVVRLHVAQVGPTNWTQVSSKLSNGAVARTCRERWLYHLDPAVNHGPWTSDEDAKMEELYTLSSGSWAVMAHSMPGRTDMQIKNRWNATRRPPGIFDGFCKEELVSLFSEAAPCALKEHKAQPAAPKPKPNITKVVKPTIAKRAFNDPAIKFKMTFNSTLLSIANKPLPEKGVPYKHGTFAMVNAMIKKQPDAREQKWDGLGKLMP